MNNLLSSLLVKLAQRDVADKDLYAMVESLDIIAAAMLDSLPEEQGRRVTALIDSALQRQEESSQPHYKSDLDLLAGHIHRVTDVIDRK